MALCRGGKKRIPGVKYSEKVLKVTPQLAWRAAMESAATTPQLALALRTLDAHLRWDDLRRPTGECKDPHLLAELRGRRAAGARVAGYEYLLHLQVPPRRTSSPTASGGASACGTVSGRWPAARRRHWSALVPL